MLHKGILPHHTKWVKLFENLRYVVVDELHSHRGVYGSHVANVFRRLQRLCRFYGSDPQFLCSLGHHRQPEGAGRSAHRPRDDARRPERGAARREVLRDLQPAGGEPAARASASRPWAAPATSPCPSWRKGMQTIVFAPSRLSTEVLVTYLKEALETRPGLRGHHPRLSRRLPAPEAARDRARPARGLGPGRRLHQRPRAGHRHRQPRRGRAPGLSGQRRLDLAAGGARGPAQRDLGGGAGGQLDARSTSSSPRTPTTSSAPPPSRAASTPTTSRSSSPT